MAKVSVECPGCFAKLNLSDRSKLGKKIKCPKCAEVFLAEAPDDEDEEEFVEEEDEKPAKPSGGRPRPTAGGGKKSGKKSGGSGGGNQGLLIGGGIAAALVLLVAGLFFAGVFGGAKPQPAAVAGAAPAPVVAAAVPNGMSPTEKMLALRWMPAETELILHVKLADIWKAPLLKGLVENPQAVMSVQELQKYVGVGPADIESVTIGVTDLKGIQSASMMAAMGMPPAASQIKGLIVVRSKQSVSQSAILQANPSLKSIDHNGKSYCEFPQLQAGAPGSAPSVGAWVADANTVVIGGAEELKGAMDRGETVTPRKELMFADAAPHVVLVVAPKDLQALRPTQPPSALPGVPPQIAEMQQTINESMQGFGIGLNIRGGFDFQTSFLLKDAADVAKVKTGLEAALVEGRKQFEVTKATAPPLLGDLGQMLLDNLKLGEESLVLKVSTSVPDSAQPQLEQLPPLLMVMAMTGGLNPGVARPGSSPAESPGTTPPTVPSNPNVAEQPIETAAVSPVKVEGLPDGVTLTLSTGWGLSPTMDSASKSIQPIELRLNVEGDGLNKVCGYGPVSIKTLTLADGKALKVARAGIDLSKMTLPFEGHPIQGGNSATGRLRAAIAVEPPADHSKPISIIEGTLTLMTSDDSKEYVVDEAPKKALRALSDPGLKAAGVKLLLAKPDGQNGESLVLSCGKGHLLGMSTATTPGNANGQLQFFLPELDKGHTVHRLRAFDEGKKLPSNLQVKIVVHRDIQEHVVSFRFEEAALPTIESKPALKVQ